MKHPVLSMCVCCRNAASRVEDTLWSLILQTADFNTYEILVIDNASDDIDQLKSLIMNMGNEGHKIRLVEEPNIGLSYARNRGVKESNGDYVFFIDDDAIANARLAEHYIKSIEEHKPDVIGGNIFPLFAVQPPRELDYSCWGKWSLKHFGDSDRWLDDGEYFIGTNIGALRKLLITHPFNSELGRKGESLVGGEEWYLGDSRFRRRFVAGAYVLHKVPGERMSTNYFAKRSLGAMHQQGQKIRLLQLLIG
ncbi:unnamed protein product, partial [marine sediment metagenome]